MNNSYDENCQNGINTPKELEKAVGNDYAFMSYKCDEKFPIVERQTHILRILFELENSFIPKDTEKYFET